MILCSMKSEAAEYDFPCVLGIMKSNHYEVVQTTSTGVMKVRAYPASMEWQKTREALS